MNINLIKVFNESHDLLLNGLKMTVQITLLSLIIALVLCLIAMVIIIFYNEKRVMKTIEEGHDKEAAILKGNSHE